MKPVGADAVIQSAAAKTVHDGALYGSEVGLDAAIPQFLNNLLRLMHRRRVNPVHRVKVKHEGIRWRCARNKLASSSQLNAT